MSKSTTSRRGFFGQVGQVVAAVPLAIAVPAATGEAPAAERRQYPGLDIHKEGFCHCPACREARYRRPNHPLARAAVIAGYKALCAVDDLAHVHDCAAEKCNDRCNVLYHADNIRALLATIVDSQADCLLADDAALDAAHDLYHETAWHARPPFEADFLDEAVRAMEAYRRALETVAEAPDCPNDFAGGIDGDMYLAEMFAANLSGCQ